MTIARLRINWHRLFFLSAAVVLAACSSSSTTNDGAQTGGGSGDTASTNSGGSTGRTSASGASTAGSSASAGGTSGAGGDSSSAGSTATGGSIAAGGSKGTGGATHSGGAGPGGAGSGRSAGFGAGGSSGLGGSGGRDAGVPDAPGVRPDAPIAGGGGTSGGFGGSRQSAGGTSGGAGGTHSTAPNAGSALTFTTTSCPAATQGQPYSCTLAVSGGTGPYTFSVPSSSSYAPLPEGMALDGSTGVISSSLVGGQGTYGVQFQVADSANHVATTTITFSIAGNNAFLASIFPSNSIFRHRVDAASTGLPVDTSPAAPIYSGYQSSHIKVFFGNADYLNMPNGIPAIQVPYNQPDVPVATTQYQSYYTSGPIPPYAPVEGTSVSEAAGGDGHVLVYVEGGGGNPPALYEMWQGVFLGAKGWTDSSNAMWSDVSSNALTAQGNGTTDEAGLPVAPLLVNVDEVIGTGTPSAPSGVVQHPIRFTTNHTLNYWVWPATETAGQGSCSGISTGNLLSQSTPPASCTFSGVPGEIYRLNASVATPSCASTSPQANIIITGFRNYGIILADNGDTGGLIGTPDSRWNDDDLSCLTNITLADFEPVNVSSLMVSADSGETAH